MLIDRQYFRGELSVPNTDSQAVGSKLDAFIAKYEVKFLGDVLGLPLYRLFRAGLLVTPTVDAKWITLRDGDGEDWKGLIYTEGEGVRRSPIANFVYFHWMRDAVSTWAAQGEKLPTLEGGTRTAANGRMARVWNELCDEVSGLYTFVSSNLTDYPQYEELDFTRIREYRKINHLGI